MVSNSNYVPKLYQEIHQKLKQETNEVIGRKQFNIILGRCFHCPDELKSGIIKGLEKHNLIIVIDKFKIKVNDIETNKRGKHGSLLQL